MPWKEIPKDTIIFDPKVQLYCNNPKYRCPYYEHSWGCPPKAPYLEEEVMAYERYYLIYFRFDLKDKNSGKIADSPSYKDMRKVMEKEMEDFIHSHQGKSEEMKILWDGHCRTCEKEGKTCTLDEGIPCRYPDKIKYSMEAVGINVTETVKKANLDIEWPPINHVFRFGLVCEK